MATYTQEQNKLDSQGLYDMFLAIHSCPVPVIARVNGAALGGGSGLVAACDFAYALEGAKLGFTEVGLGLIPAVISRFCIDKIGQVHAARYFVTGERFSATEAQRIGLVSSVYPDAEQLDAAIMKTLGFINNNSPAAVRAAKQLVRDVSRGDRTVDQPETRDFTAAAIAGIRVSSEGQAGLKAFLSKGKGPWVLKK
jgi:methylglutaconyl-CoA hydratase